MGPHNGDEMEASRVLGPGSAAKAATGFRSGQPLGQLVSAFCRPDNHFVLSGLVGIVNRSSLTIRQ